MYGRQCGKLILRSPRCHLPGHPCPFGPLARKLFQQQPCFLDWHPGGLNCSADENGILKIQLDISLSTIRKPSFCCLAPNHFSCTVIPNPSRQHRGRVFNLHLKRCGGFSFLWSLTELTKKERECCVIEHYPILYGLTLRKSLTKLLRLLAQAPSCSS